MKNFCDVEVGDTVYYIKIVESTIQETDSIQELKIVNVEEISNATHYIITLSDKTIITPSGMFPFHTIQCEGPKYEIDVLSPLSEEIYATNREECLRIASNLVKMKMKRMHKLIDACKTQLNKLGSCAINVFELKRNLPVEVKTEAVIV